MTEFYYVRHWSLSSSNSRVFSLQHATHVHICIHLQHLTVAITDRGDKFTGRCCCKSHSLELTQDSFKWCEVPYGVRGSCDFCSCYDDDNIDTVSVMCVYHVVAMFTCIICGLLWVTCDMFILQGGPGVGPAGQGGLHAAGGPTSNGDKAMHVRNTHFVLLWPMWWWHDFILQLLCSTEWHMMCWCAANNSSLAVTC